MRILLDNNPPIAFKRRWTHDGEILHCLDLGWDRLANGALVRAADARFDVMLTIDKNMAFQTPLRGLSLAVLVLDVRSNKLDDVLRFVPLIDRTLTRLTPGTYRWLRLDAEE